MQRYNYVNIKAVIIVTVSIMFLFTKLRRCYLRKFELDGLMPEKHSSTCGKQGDEWISQGGEDAVIPQKCRFECPTQEGSS